MKKIFAITMAIALFFSLLGLIEQAKAQVSEARIETRKNTDLKTATEGNKVFALDLYAQLKETEGNLFFSPYSISTALAMTYAGARGNTEKQMADVLHFTLGQDRLHPAFASLESWLNAVQKKNDIQLSVANALWPQKGYVFLPEFFAVLKENYGAPLYPVDFNNPLAREVARQKINAWVEDKTKGKIQDIIQPGILSELTALVLTNAIYFKGDWQYPFEEGRTKDEPFFVMPNEQRKVPTMQQQRKFGYMENKNLQMLEMPYAGGDLSMIVLLPRKIDGLAQLETALNQRNLNAWMRRLKRTKVKVFLPKFKMTSQFNLAATLAAMGMPDAFGSASDFSGMTGKKDLFISAVIHKAFVDVNEKGTEAAAATAVVMKLRRVHRSPPPPPVFRADHPFIFLIRDNTTGSILFFGRVADPTK